MELVDPLEILGLAENHQVRVAPGPDQREGSQQVAVGEVGARGDELALVRRAPLLVEPPPGGIYLQEGVFHVVAGRHLKVMIRRRSRASREQKLEPRTRISDYR